MKKETEVKHEDQAFNLWVLIQQTKDAVFRARNKELLQYGISPREAATLRAIWNIGEKVTPAILARWTYRKPQTITGILRRMSNKGYLELTKDPYIKNIVRIRITEKGNNAIKYVLKIESIHRIFNTIDCKSQNRLESYLTLIRDEALRETGDVIQRPFP